MEPIAYSVRTPEGDSGPYFDLEEVRGLVRAYRDDHGDAALKDVAVFCLKDSAGNGAWLNPGELL